MTYKNIFIPFFDESRADAAFAAAALIAKQEKSHISAVHMRQRPLPPYDVYFPLGGTFTPQSDESYLQAEEENADALRERFNNLCKEHGVAPAAIGDHKDEMGATASWRDEEGDIPADLVRIAAAADLIVVASEAEEAGAPLAEDLLFQSGRPVLLCPAAGIASLPERVVITWNASAEAARAVASSSPFLHGASAVKVLTIHEPSRVDVKTADIAATLRLHGLDTSETEIELEPDERASDVLVREIEDAKADLVVMGAYSHSRWREAVLGGFTRHMLNKAAVPVLLAR